MSETTGKENGTEKFNHRPMFYFDDRSAVFQAVPSEGTSDENPIILPIAIMQFDFDCLLTYMYKGPSVHPKTDEFLVAVMKLSAYLEIEDDMSHCTAEFTRRGDDFHPALQFELARCYRVDQWIEPAFCQLMAMPILELNLEHMAQIEQVGCF
ncbi:hypothetical protein C8J57DRAFT_1524338 [Mycena rebaudengoi]|nr:hypothetical protein C8J57DRAFT_1524338 [Mycena rebaudengoi]